MKLFDQLISIKNEKLISFHVPGHKNSSLYKKYFSRLESILDIDITEIPGSDDLFDASSCIKESQEILSSLIGSKASYFLVNGTTSGIYAMIMAATQPGDEILIARDCHRAVYDGAFLGRLKIRYVEPTVMHGISIGITPEAVRKAIKKHPNVKALVLTYPNYYGIGADLKSIKSELDKSGIKLLVDEAHGAHLFLSEDLMPSAIKLAADIVVHSAHKSLPVMTQASVLHLNSDRIDKDKLEMMLKLHQTSSPSYILMSSLDIGYDILKEHGRPMMDNLLKTIEEFKKKKDYFLSKKDLPEGFFLDSTKLTLLGNKADINPVDLELQLRKYGIQLEFSNDKVAVFVSSIMNKSEDFDILSKTMEMLKFKCYSGIDNNGLSYESSHKLDLHDAIYSKKSKVSLDSCENMIVGDYITPYPPGIPLLVPGEIIDHNKVSLIKKMLEMNIKIVGINDHHISVISNEEAK